ncbi:para-nitrobenzyl esterase [Corynespora cassiicola Philippines]|uniref:Para-nitrobenzyl esterase n=1 Tax=Corynespora cassiicola Philippines TaxID=1448308 RepID=A0A2T2NAW6_CORCC|nr:para-nitrobenzyl esterase [Corynespora cassiicola Philippines]
MTTTLKTSFATFKGKKQDGVIQYLGVKYASLSNQLSVPEMVTEYGNGIVDATAFGPRCVAKDACDIEQNMLIQKSIGIPTPPPMSGIDSLNLNITVPDIETKRQLPVLVFIHGGGFLMGSSHWPQYDPSRLVKLSVDTESPVIAININYRLRVLGNLTSEELRKAGYPGNNSLRDQKCALQWIKKHISDFGGDPDNVTAFGESAGAVSVLCQLLSQDPLFKRGISMAGTPIMLKPLPLPVTEMAYGMVLKALDLEDATPEERVQRLITVQPDELVAKIPLTIPLLPYLDGDVIPEQTTFEKLASVGMDSSTPGRQWCSDLMIGDCQHDGSVFFFMGLAERKSGIAIALSNSFRKNFADPSAAEAVLEAYSITTTTDDDTALKQIMNLVTDVAYYAPALAYAKSWPGKAYYYNFNELNPWDGALKGLSTHLLDAVFLFQNYNEHLTEEARQVAVTMARDFIKFANGLEPWKQFNKEAGGTKVYGPSETSIEKFTDGQGWGQGRRDTLFRLEREGKLNLDELSVAWDLFIAGQ